jgi:flavin-dependent dehydrogenase
LRLRGAEVEVFEARRPPLDKPCGEGILPDGWARLLALGVEPAGHPLGGIRYRAPALVVDAPFPAGPGRGVRRLELHHQLLIRACALGVGMHWGSRAQRATPQGELETKNGTRRFDLIAAADGLRSPLRRQLGLERPGRSLERFGARAHFRLAPEDDRVEVWWSERTEAYVTPLAADTVGVALLSDVRPLHFDALLQTFPELARRLAGSRRLGPVLGTGPLEQRVRGRVAGRVALIGDAAGYLDAITGEGLSLGLHQVELLIAALDRGDLGWYERRVAAVAKRADLAAKLWLATAKRPALRRRALASLALHPGTFAGLLAAHVEGERPRLVDLVRLIAGLARRAA